MTTLDRVRELRERVQEIQEVRKLKKHAEALENKREVLEAYRLEWQHAVDSAGVLIKNKCLQNSSMPDPRRLQDLLEASIATFSDDPGSLTKGRNFTKLTKSFESTTTTLREATANAWAEETNAAPKINEPFLAQVARIRGQRRVVEQLREASGSLAEASQKPPGEQAEWDHYQTLLRKVKEGLEALDPSKYPKSVLEFCLAAQSGGAALSMLTKEVRAWLAENNMLDGIVYRFK